MTQEALKLALYYLEQSDNYLGSLDHSKPIAAIKEALAQTQEPPKYSFKAHWEKDGRIGVVAAIVRSDGGVHLLQDIIDAPQRTWVGLTDEEIKAFDAWHDNREEEIGWCNPSEIVAYIEAKLKEKNI